MENMDPPPCESQPSGKIRKGFKLFGKRKPGNIFSIRSKGDGNKSPVNKSKTLDGLSETAAPDLEQDPDKEKGPEVSQGEREQAEEELFGEDGVLAAADARASISSTCSVKSLSFLSLLRGGRRGVGDRRVHTVSQPVSRQRRGLKGLFGNVKFRSKDKEDKEEAPPSPLLMSSRANSVEIIKEDLTLTPQFQPRSLDSPETESLATPDRKVPSLSETITPQVTAGSVSRTDERAPEPPFVPGDNSLSSLLADISSLLTFDSISGGGDIMADVEAEWGKASSAISAVVSDTVTPPSASLFSKPFISSPLTSSSVSTAAVAKPYSVAIPTTASSQSFTPLTTFTSSPIAKPSTIITTLTKSSTLTTQSVKSNSDSTAASASIKIKSIPMPTMTQLSTTPLTFTSLSPPIMSSSTITIKSTQSSTSATTTAPPNTPATIAKPPSVSLTLTSTASKLASELAAPPPAFGSVSKSIPVATPHLVSARPPPVMHSPPTPVAFMQPPSTKLDSASSLNLQTSTSYKPLLTSAAAGAKATVTESSAPVIPSKMTTVPTSTTTSGSASTDVSKPKIPSSQMGPSKTPPSLVTVPDYCPPPTLSPTTKTQPSPASVPTPSSTSLDKIPPTAKPTPVPVSLDKTPPAPTPTLTPSSHAVVSTASPTPPVPSQSPKDPIAPAQIPISVSKYPHSPAQIPVSVSKDLPLPTQTQVCVCKDPPASVYSPVTVSKDPPTSVYSPVTVSKDPPTSVYSPVTVSKDPPTSVYSPVTVSKDPPSSVYSPITVPKDPPAPAQIPVSQSKAPPASVYSPISVSKAPPAPGPAPCPVLSLPSAPEHRQSEAPGSAKMTGSGQVSTDCLLVNPSSTGGPGAQTTSSKTKELHSESRTSLQGPPREKKTPPAKASGLSKIPVVGGGRAGKLPVRDSQHCDDEASRDPTSPVLEEERPRFNSDDAGRSKDKICDVDVLTLKHSQEENQQPPQPKVQTSLPRDSKIPVKHGAQAHVASQIPQAKEPHRTKIPVSKVPVRRAGNKPAVAGSSTHMRK
ncbi:hypothetical protein F2P81_008809 [Scophthalmus maximus]|uniref:APC membrane recruitment protein 2-like n=1 Tax=Scophthalmus maximus TaxID=52904 RepID=A0A6A4SZW7_SCOMX|nr:hypothetical protein F2P81_008809 [Scophthalmus maximus]